MKIQSRPPIVPTVSITSIEELAKAVARAHVPTAARNCLHDALGTLRFMKLIADYYVESPSVDMMKINIKFPNELIHTFTVQVSQ